MKSLVAIAAFASVLFAPANAQLDGMTAGDLSQLCSSSDSESKYRCHLYILGIAQGIVTGMEIADGKTRGGRPCVPSSTPGSALELAVKLKLGDDLMVFPHDRELDAAGFVAYAIIKSFPCEPQN